MGRTDARNVLRSYQGEKLINKLTVYHFGYLRVFAAENDRSTAPLAPGDGMLNP